MVSLVNSIKLLKNKLTSLLFKFFQKTEKERTLSNTFNEASIILIAKSDKDSRRNYRTISLMNIDVKMFNKILTSQT